MDQFDPWQVVPRQVFTPYSRLLISTAFVVVSPIGCLRDGWMTCDLMSFSTVFQSYQDNGMLIMKGYVQWNSIYS